MPPTPECHPAGSEEMETIQFQMSFPGPGLIHRHHSLPIQSNSPDHIAMTLPWRAHLVSHALLCALIELFFCSQLLPVAKASCVQPPLRFLPQSYCLLSWLVRFSLLVRRGQSRILSISLCSAVRAMSFLVFLRRVFFFAGVRERHYFCNQTQLTTSSSHRLAREGRERKVGEDQGESLRQFPTAPATSGLELWRSFSSSGGV